MTNAQKLRAARRAVRAAILKSRSLPSEEAFQLVRHAALIASKVMREVADDLEPPE